jgi:outer membrane protein assembly factor BamB
MRTRTTLILFATHLLLASTAFAADWPQWKGPNRDGVCTETNLMEKWPDGGPKLLWSYEGLVKGFSTVSVCDGFVYVTGMTDDRKEKLFAFDSDGNLKWEKLFGSAWTGESYPDSRTTPTVNDGFVYVISGIGEVAAFDARTGDEKWNIKGNELFAAEYHGWGIAESPLVVDDKVIFTPGGNKTSIVALNKKTGETVWTSESIAETSTYCSPLLIEHGGRQMIIQRFANTTIAVDPKDGKILWRFDQTPILQARELKPHGINVNMPIYSDGILCLSSGYDTGSYALKIADDNASVTKLWEDGGKLDCHHGSIVLVNGLVFGSTHQHFWVCEDFKTGEVKYREKWVSKGSIACADGLLYCHAERDGTIALVKPTPEAFTVISEFNPGTDKKQGPFWSHPVIANGRLYLRHGQILKVYDITAAEG